MDLMTRARGIRLTCGIGLLLFLYNVSIARTVILRDPREGILPAELVVIVQQQTPDEYEIEEVFWGKARIGDSIVLPEFKLFTMQQYGPDLVEPIVPATRILLFLQRKQGDPGRWEPAQNGYCFFWVHEQARLFELRNMAQEAVVLRKQWEAAASIQDPRQRLEALWPFLHLREYGVGFYERTKAEFEKTGPVAGDFIAERFEAMSRERWLLFSGPDAYGSEALHQTLIRHLASRQRSYEDYLAQHAIDGKTVLENWNEIPEQIKDVYGDVYYATAALAGFRDRSDLPLIREVAQWAIEHGLQQTCEAALGAFRYMPDEANLPVIQAIWEEYGPREEPGNPLIRYQLIRSLSAHLFPEAVPILAPFANDPFAGSEVREALAKIAGTDLGAEPEPWLEWFEVYQQKRGRLSQ